MIVFTSAITPRSMTSQCAIDRRHGADRSAGARGDRACARYSSQSGTFAGSVHSASRSQFQLDEMLVGAPGRSVAAASDSL